MPISLYAAIVPQFQRILGAVEGLVDKAESHCTENNIAPEEIIQARLAADMRPFAFQVVAAVGHSAYAFERLPTGLFSPNPAPLPDSFAALRAKLSDGRTALAAVDPQEVENLVGRDMRFEAGSIVLDFTVENFLLSFSQPNFYFHATTIYDILRMKGLPIGKFDFLGQLAVKG